MALAIQVSFANFVIPNHQEGYPPFYNPVDCLPPPPCGCGCPCNCPPPVTIPPQCGQRPVRFASGELIYSATDLDAHGFGAPWGHTRSFANQLSQTANVGNGNNWQVEHWSYLLPQSDGSVAVMGKTAQVLWFSQVNGQYVPAFAIKDTLVFDPVNNIFSLYDLEGGVTVYTASGTFQILHGCGRQSGSGGLLFGQQLQFHRSPAQLHSQRRRHHGILSLYLVQFHGYLPIAHERHLAAQGRQRLVAVR